MDRHGRQTRLTDVGSGGMACIAAARAALPLGGAAAVVAARYLAGAGVGELHVTNADVASEARAVDPTTRVVVDPSLGAGERTPSPFALSDPSADAVAQGAHAALVILRRALGVTA